MSALHAMDRALAVGMVANIIKRLEDAWKRATPEDLPRDARSRESSALWNALESAQRLERDLDVLKTVKP